MRSIKEIAYFYQKPKIITLQNENHHKINIQVNEPQVLHQTYQGFKSYYNARRTYYSGETIEQFQ